MTAKRHHRVAPLPPVVTEKSSRRSTRTAKRRHRVTPLPPSETLPTMYDLPDEEIGQPGMPDIFHIWQPRLLDETFRPPNYGPREYFTATDMNVYYDVYHPRRNKRPDWFAVVGLPKNKKPEMRLSYVIWQEGIAPLIIVELLSPSTRKEDLGQTLRVVKTNDKEPTKWEVYERYLRVPYYVTFSRYNDEMRIFQLTGTRFVELSNHKDKLWLPEIELGLGVWHGAYAGEEAWLRWYDQAGQWLPSQEESINQERQRAEAAEAKAARAEAEAARLAERLRQLGHDPDR